MQTQLRSTPDYPIVSTPSQLTSTGSGRPRGGQNDSPSGSRLDSVCNRMLARPPIRQRTLPWQEEKERLTQESKRPIMETAMEQKCAVCGEGFLVPVAEQQFRRERGLPDPVSCPECRTRQRSIRNADLIALYERVESHSMTESGSITTRGGAHANDRTGSRSNVSKQRFNTVCAACGAETQVPFVPRGDRPVYCRDCFNARKGR